MEKLPNQNHFKTECSTFYDLSPDNMRATIDQLGISIRKASREIGVAHTTLSRYLRGEIKRHNKNNDDKMLGWLINNNSKGTFYVNR